MHCTHSCGSLVKQFPISNEPDLTIYPRKHCRKQDAAAGGPGGRVPGPRRLRADRPGAWTVAGGPVGCADGCGRTGRAHAQTNIQNNSFIIPFISIHLLNNFLMFRSPAFSSQFSCKFLVNNSFSTTISSVDFICKSIPLTF